ncbi:MAG: hypothetical protein ACOCVP_00750 [Wenzhouxiangella sp.]
MVTAVLVLLLALIGLPLFALVALSGLSAFRQAGLDEAAFMLEFNRLAEVPELAVLPMFSAAGLILARDPRVARLVRCGQAQEAVSAVVLGLVAPGLGLLVFAAAAALLVPEGSPGHATLLRVGLLVAAIVSAFAFLTGRLSGPSGRADLRRQGRAALGVVWPPAALVGLLYVGWPNPIAVAALVFVWVTLDQAVFRGRMSRAHVPELVVAGVVRTIPAVLILGLTIAATALWQHRLSWPQGEGVMFALISQTSAAAGSALVAVAAGFLISRAIAATALVAPGAILLAQASGLDLLVQGLVLSVAVALGGGLRRRAARTRAAPP